MFTKPGRSLMEFARSLFFALLIFFIGFGAILMATSDLVQGILVMFIGSLGSIVACLLLAAIGQVVESLRIIAISTHAMAGEPMPESEAKDEAQSILFE